ncbi:MAG: hypothetical protein Q4D42_06010 [Eubacteriales bacterium]|nr:hypothetical protein [Eubacteriales bacterium]
MQRQDQTKYMTFGAIMAALGVVLLLLGSIIPGMRLSCVAIASVLAAMVFVRCGFGYALLCVIATALLSFLLVPAKEVGLLYAVFFGPYALIKNGIERLHNLPLEWVVKLAYCGVTAVLLFWFSDQVLAMVPELLAAHLWLYLPVILILFAVYDIVFSKLIAYLSHYLHLR